MPSGIQVQTGGIFLKTKLKMKKPKPGPKPKTKEGSISGKDARSQAVMAARVSRKINKGKVEVRINPRTVLLVHPDQVEDVKNQYGL